MLATLFHFMHSAKGRLMHDIRRSRQRSRRLDVSNGLLSPVMSLASSEQFWNSRTMKPQNLLRRLSSSTFGRVDWGESSRVQNMLSETEYRILKHLDEDPSDAYVSYSSTTAPVQVYILVHVDTCQRFTLSKMQASMSRTCTG